jgi:transcriptional regulator of arginine metabolism
MNARKERLDTIRRIIQTDAVHTQEELLKRLESCGVSITQATLSRDIRQLKVARIHDGNESYVYRLPETPAGSPAGTLRNSEGQIEFSGNLAVVKTRPGHAMAVAYDIDTHTPPEILGTVAGDDTILIIPREGYDRKSVAEAINRFIR